MNYKSNSSTEWHGIPDGQLELVDLGVDVGAPRVVGLLLEAVGLVVVAGLDALSVQGGPSELNSGNGGIVCIRCLMDIFQILVCHLSNSIGNTSISGAKSSWTSLYFPNEMCLIHWLTFEGVRSPRA